MRSPLTIISSVFYSMLMNLFNFYDINNIRILTALIHDTKYLIHCRNWEEMKSYCRLDLNIWVIRIMITPIEGMSSAIQGYKLGWSHDSGFNNQPKVQRKKCITCCNNCCLDILESCRRSDYEIEVVYNILLLLHARLMPSICQVYDLLRQGGIQVVKHMLDLLVLLRAMGQ